jgi:hypothetical protein
MYDETKYNVRIAQGASRRHQSVPTRGLEKNFQKIEYILILDPDSR